MPTERPTAAERQRVALYAHDACGLGHVRRNLALAGALTAAGADALVVTGHREAGQLPLPPRTDLLVLPGVTKDAAGDYHGRALGSERALAALRAGALHGALTGFAPDLLIVDKRPRGLHGEIEPALRALRRTTGTRTVLGLRDVLDEPCAVRREWAEDRSAAAVAQLYDEVWVYGDASVYDVVTACGLPASVAARARFTGYLAAGRHRAGGDDAPALGGRPYDLCLVGGGQDGVAIAMAFATAPRPAGVTGVIVTGPFMPADDRRRLAAVTSMQPDVAVEGFVPGVDRWLQRARAVVAMAGYNTTCELLACGQRALLVPRVRPRLEQLLRAQQLAARGLADVLHPDDLAPAAIGRWLAGPHPRISAGRVDLDGLGRVAAFARRLLATPAAPALRSTAQGATSGSHYEVRRAVLV